VNLKEYISSGIIESYVLGIATEAEREEFEAMCKQHPEVVQARNNFELSLENRLLQDAVPPPMQLKEKLQATFTNTDTATANYNEEVVETPVRRLSVWKIMAAASILLLAGTAFWAFSLNNKYREAQKANESLKQQLTQSSAALAEVQRASQTLQNPALKTATLQGTENAPGSFANIYWDTTSKDVYLLVNNMPKPATNKQYQLWALIEGKPIDLGVIDEKVWQQKLLIKMKNVPNAQAFAITLEREGGSPTPEGSMYVKGEL
jgi:anti-sigma-K factor RskA